jgi:hypothetical protein
MPMCAMVCPLRLAVTTMGQWVLLAYPNPQDNVHHVQSLGACTQFSHLIVSRSGF